MPFTLAQLAGLFVAPALAVAGVACVAIPIAIHLLSRSRRKRAEWGAMRFLRLAYKKQKRRLRMEKWLLLATRCLIVALAGLALAGPMLSGAWAGWLTGSGDGRGGRTVHVVLDDGLSTRGLAGAGTRFDRLRGLAVELVDGLGPNDRVQLWTTGGPGGGPGGLPGVGSPTRDHAAVRAGLAAMEPGYAASDLAGVLSSVSAAVDAEAFGGARPVVAVLSDWERGQPALAEPVPAEAMGLGERARLVVARPEVGAGNVQVQRVGPRRSLVLAGGSSSRVAVEAVVRRQSDTSGAQRAGLTLTLRRPDGRGVSQVTREVSWSAGQSVATVSVDLPLTGARAGGIGGDAAEGAFGNASGGALRADFGADSGGISGGTSGDTSGGVWSVTAELVAEAGGADALKEDNERYAVVEVRSRLNVAVVEEGGEGSGGELSAGAFVRAALSPGQSGERFAVVAQPMVPSAVEPGTLGGVDAAVVLEPGRVSAAGWEALGGFARGGGLVWVFPSAEALSAGGVADWFGLMREAMGLDWGLTAGSEALPTAVGLDTDTRPPGALVLLSADWPALLGPVRVSRALSVSSAPEAVWVKRADGGGFLWAAGVGAGRVLLSGVAADPLWTNLPTKPLFPALLHDALRGVLGEADRAAGSEVVVGDRPRLGDGFAGVSALVSGEREVLLGRGLAGETGGETGTGGEGVRALSAFVEPGVYGARAGGSGRRLAVNVPADAGDLRSVDGAYLEGWLGALGAWSYVESDSPAAALGEAAAWTGLGWSLLWVLLGLVGLEMGMARWFSHAGAGRGSSAGSGVGTLRRRRSLRRAAGWGAGFLVGAGCLGWGGAAEASWVDGWLGLDEVSWSEATAVGWRYPLPAWAWVLIAFAGFAAAWWSYRGLMGPAGVRAGLAGLRGALIVLIAVLLAGPEVVRTDEVVEEDVLVVLVDRSASMGIADVPAGEGSGGLVTREAALRRALAEQGAVFGEDGLGRGRRVMWLGFGESVFELAGGEAAAGVPGEPGIPGLGEPTSMGTRLRGALDEAVRRASGRPISGVVLITDGRSPEATGASAVARLGEQSVRVFSVPVGAERLPLDVAVVRVDPPATAFINDPVPVTVVVDQPGASGGGRAEASRVTVRLVDLVTERVLDERPVGDGGFGRPLRLAGRSGAVGEAQWRVEVVYDAPPGGEGELNLANNTATFAVALVDRPIRVLYLEGYPRWEYRYLKNMLIREKSIDSSVFLLSADRAFAQEGDTPITRLPVEAREWEGYDVVIVGDVAAQVLSPEQRKQLLDVVAERGAGLLWIGGPEQTPGSYAATLLEDLLPMREVDQVSVLPAARLDVRPTPLAESLSVLQLRSAGEAEAAGADGAEPAGGRWPEGLPVLRWGQDLGRLKPSAEVLARATLGGEAGSSPGPAAVEDDADASVAGWPVVTRLRFGAGQSVYVATDETWRWRFARGEVYFEQFWVQLVRMLGRATAARGDERVRLSVSSRRTPVGGTVVADLTVEDAGLLARDLPSVRVAVRRAGDGGEGEVGQGSGPALAEFELRPSDAPGDTPGAR
ncbi:MAG: BatA domain-containing protein, partial [Planctomycetota bacterium]